MPVSAQEAPQTVKGKVTDEKGAPMLGVTIVVQGTTNGVTTDLDGAYELRAAADATLLFSYVGYQPQQIAVGARSQIDVQLQPDAQSISDVVVIGYGTVTKKDLTGSVSSVSSKDFNEGLISSPEQLINGKVSGVQILSSGGSPTSGSTIRIRGGASLNASNDPLIVLDGVPLESGGVGGIDANFLSLINPNDIESMTVLKDASSTAIYGSRASNGVIMITTKKGSGSDKLRINYSTTLSLQQRTRTADMLSYDDFVRVATSIGETSLLGDAHTDWNDAIYRTAFGTDNNLSVAGRFSQNFPFRVSVGYYNQDGIVLTDNATRYTGNISLSPSFFDNYLKFNFSAKGAINKNRYAPASSAIYNATVANPTQPIYSGSDAFGGYNEIIVDGVPSTNALVNPVGLLRQTDYHDTVKRIIANADVDYRMHFLPDLKLHMTVGYDYATGESSNFVPAEAASNYRTGGLYTPVGPNENINRLFTAYLNYNKEIASIRSRIDATFGYDYQFWKATTAAGDSYNAAGESLNSAWLASDQRHVLLSYYGRLNYSYDSRYMLTATVRRDASSRFAKEHRWGTFPSVALAWRLSQESFLRDSKVVSDLKLRASYGETGQQDGIGNYGYLPVYYPSSGSNSQYITGGYGNYGGYYQPGAYVSDLTWETTQSWNAGVDFGFFNNRLSGSVDYYTRKTRDLLATVPTAAGTNFTRTITTNVGNVESEGVEVTLNAVPVDTPDWTWNLSANMTWQKVNITNLSLIEGADITPTLVGSEVDSKQVQAFAVGYTPYAFYVYKQVYDENGRPLEGVYADLNGDGQINIDDRYFYHSPSPDLLVGFSTSVRWKRLTLSTSLRASFGNYAYNATAANNGALETMKYAVPQLYNLSTSYLKTGFTTRQIYSDYYVENASFLKMDNLILSYDFGRLFRDTMGLNLSFMVQNVFTVTNYTGVDPEISGGIDQNFYPRPRIFSLSVGLTF
ncbi:TonB-dependent receptor [uncultured Alistipes sp.]|uniref:SusC/RagA family TonB-linked outer membrane protein n=1 Tax=uncultured Alistipes sp. TaxID=538949 RepID=UPI002637E5E8|nr:TonB-dependent receptor [uncultured Alistipes sp.]